MEGIRNSTSTYQQRLLSSPYEGRRVVHNSLILALVWSKICDECPQNGLCYTYNPSPWAEHELFCKLITVVATLAKPEMEVRKM